MIFEVRNALFFRLGNEKHFPYCVINSLSILFQYLILFHSGGGCDGFCKLFNQINS